MVRLIGVLILLGGMGHIVTGVLVFREQLGAILRDGFVNSVLPHFDRRAAFWFISFGVMVAMAGQVILHAESVGDVALLKIVGWYLFPLSIVGTLAMTRSPSSVLIALSLALLVVAYSS